MTVQQKIAAAIEPALDGVLTAEEIEALLEKPKFSHMGDIAFPCFTLAKKLRKSPKDIAISLSERIQDPLINRAEVENGYLNIFLQQKAVAETVMKRIVQEKEKYGSKPDNHQSVAIDLSSPNIAKPFSMGHLRSTVIGNAIANISEKNGYKTIRINHLGDWGTQFGKLIVAYRLWGDDEQIKAAPIESLLSIYVKFHEEAEHNEQLNDQAREAFKKLEEGDEEATALWKWFREVSLLEFETIYQLLGIHFDSYNGEAFYNDKMEAVVEELKEKNLLVESHGAHVVELEDMPPCLITKKDGATLYATRDLAAAFYRQRNYHPAKFFYVVGNEQSLHFKQLIKVIERMGYDWSQNIQHVPFGMMLTEGKKMSTRKGKVVLLADVLKEAIDTAKSNIEEKNPDLENKDEVAEQVGVGAVIFNDLRNYRMNDIDFSLEQMLTFEGETGPYLQYTYARIQSLLQKGDFNEEAAVLEHMDETAWPVVLLLEDFPSVISKAFEQADPSLVAKLSLQVARQFNKYYANTKILGDEEKQNSRLTLAYSVGIVLKESLRLLGIQAPEKM